MSVFDRPVYGFNFLWMFQSAGRAAGAPLPGPDERALDWLAKRGFRFVRLPLDYRFWIKDFRYGEADERVLERIDAMAAAVVSRGLHCSLNLHRAPGYCINGNAEEKHNLWLDGVAQDAFAAQWASFARRYAGYPPDSLSFDLVNEPPAVGQYGLTRANHAAVVRRAAAAIRAVSPDRPIVVDGLAGGNEPLPELADLGAVQSVRGYRPMDLTHYRADWCAETRGRPAMAYPGSDADGRPWDKAALAAGYAPWRELAAAGVRVHAGEMGCYDLVDNAVALAWFRDIFAVFREARWGWALWNFEGNFGLAGHRRPGARFEAVDGYAVDRELLDIMDEFRS
jgi:hypothetical protein